MHMSKQYFQRRPAWQWNRKVLVAALAAAMILPLTSLAQSDSEEDEGVEGIEEVVVTARRREENLMDVPVSITAFTGEQLELIAATDITYVAQTTPNVTLEVSRGTNTTITAFIRGVGQQDPVAGFESGVGLYIDDVYLNRPQAGILNIYDVERIEVLRGPQGTLYGRNTIGGAIKYVTRRLSTSTEARARFTVGTDAQLDLVLTGSVPLGDTFRIGGSIARFKRDGFGKNLNIAGIDNYSKDILGGRLSAEWEPTDSLFFRLAGDYIDDDSDPRQGHRLTVGNLTGAPILDNVYDTRAGLNNPIQSVKAKGVSLLAEWQVNDTFMFRNILASRDDENWSPIDFDSLPSADLDVPVLYENDQFSEELQLVFDGERLSGVAGFYYLDANASNEFDVILGNLGALISLPGLNAYTFGDVNTKTWSLFADVTFDWTDTVSVSLGGRYTEDKRTSTVIRQTKIFGTSPVFGGTAIPIVTTSDFSGSETFDDFSPRASISWRPNDNQNLYFSYSEGFKGGSFDPRGLTTAAPDLDGDGVVSEQEIFDFMLFQPEEVNSYEIGLKSTLLDGRMTSSLAVFFADYKDVQIPGSIGFDSTGDGNNDTFIGITSNAADADISGVEWEGMAILARDLGTSGSSLDLRWAVGYIKADFNVFIDPFGNDVADERVFQNTPKWTVSGMLSYAMPMNLFANTGELAFITTLSYRDDTSQFEAPNPFLDQEAYTLWDLSIVWTGDSGHWQVGLHGKNLTDEAYKVAGYFFPTLGLEGSVTAFYGNPRQISAVVRYNWF
ncbi:MAG: TonB-dependent receptor [Gammaproteobacteria bacterium]|nr:MAG: TonB-dependent receptor [Gammaproteobacteria bacterium]